MDKSEKTPTHEFQKKCHVHRQIIVTAGFVVGYIIFGTTGFRVIKILHIDNTTPSGFYNQQLSLFIIISALWAYVIINNSTKSRRDESIIIR